MSTQDLAPWFLTYLLHSILLGGAAMLAARSLQNPAARAWVLRGGLLGALLTASLASWVGQGAQLHLPELALDEGRSVIGLSAAPMVQQQAPMSPSLVPSPVPSQALPAQVPASNQASAPAPSPLTHWPVLLLFAASLGLLRLARREWRARRTLASRIPAQDPALVERARELAGDRSLANNLRLSTCAKLSSPLALGLREVVLPLRAAELTSGERDALLAHEVAHLVRHDPIWLGFGRILSALFWFQPLHALLMRELEDQTELAADAWAANRTGAPLELARSLERVGTWLTNDYAPASTAAMARRGSSLLARVERLLESDGSTALRPALGTAAVTALALAVFACAGPAVHEAELAETHARADSEDQTGADPILFSVRVSHHDEGKSKIAYVVQGKLLDTSEGLGKAMHKLYGSDLDRAILAHNHAGVSHDYMVAVLAEITPVGFTNVRIATDHDGGIVPTVGRLQSWSMSFIEANPKLFFERVRERKWRVHAGLSTPDEGTLGRATINVSAIDDPQQVEGLINLARGMPHGPIPGSSTGEQYPTGNLVIRADRSTPFAAVARVMALCERPDVKIWRIELGVMDESIDDAVPVPLIVDSQKVEDDPKFDENGAHRPNTAYPMKIQENGGAITTFFRMSSGSVREKPEAWSSEQTRRIVFSPDSIESVIIDVEPGVSFGRVLDVVREQVAKGVKVTFAGA